MDRPKNVLGTELRSCCNDPVTGFYRDGMCRTGSDDYGLHIICVQVTDDFLEFSKRRGNDLSTPQPDFDFPGLKNGDRWCLCATRWQEAFEAGVAPFVDLEATHISALEHVGMQDLKKYALP
jgi:uncharacterized protein (DUF2237 family)